MLPYDVQDFAGLFGHRNGARAEELRSVMIAPGGPDPRRTGIDRHRHVETRITDDDGRCWRCAGLGYRLLDHGRVRLRRMPVRGLERDEAGVDAVALETVLQPALGLAGGDREQPP